MARMTDFLILDFECPKCHRKEKESVSNVAVGAWPTCCMDIEMHVDRLCDEDEGRSNE